MSLASCLTNRLGNEHDLSGQPKTCSTSTDDFQPKIVNCYRQENCSILHSLSDAFIASLLSFFRHVNRGKAIPVANAICSLKPGTLRSATATSLLPLMQRDETCILPCTQLCGSEHCIESKKKEAHQMAFSPQGWWCWQVGMAERGLLPDHARVQGACPTCCPAVLDEGCLGGKGRPAQHHWIKALEELGIPASWELHGCHPPFNVVMLKEHALHLQ